jgi:hypothetical protein
MNSIIQRRGGDNIHLGQINLIAIPKGGGPIILDIRHIIKCRLIKSGNNEQVRCEFGLTEAFGFGDGELHL